MKSKFVMCMHLMNDILEVVYLYIPGFYETLRMLIFTVKQCMTPSIAQFMEEYYPVQHPWKSVKLKSALRAQCGQKVQENTVQQNFEPFFGPFLADISHNLTGRFGPYVHPQCIFQNSKFQSFYWPTLEDEALQSYGNVLLQELLQKSPADSIGDFFPPEEIRSIRNCISRFSS
jgi:hypothetical protein